MTRSRLTAGALALAACGLIAAGCGDDDSTSSDTTSGGSSAEQSIDSAVASCKSTAQDLNQAVGAGLEAACTSVGDSAKKALQEGGEQAQQALSQAEDSCKQSVAQVPKGQAQEALNRLCEAIAAD
jgi:hypothetical protein